MATLSSWSFRRVVFTGLAWIIGIQLLFLWRPLMLAIAAYRAHPSADYYIIAPHRPGGPLLVIGPPFVLCALWWWARRSRPAV
jgi:hypothetical protein